MGADGLDVRSVSRRLWEKREQGVFSFTRTYEQPRAKPHVVQATTVPTWNRISASREQRIEKIIENDRDQIFS